MTPAAGTPQPGSLDAAALARLRELDPEGRTGVVRRVLVAYEASLARAVVALQAAQAGGDTGEVGRVAHALKSSSASVGALALADECARVETLVRGRAAGDLGAAVLRMHAEGMRALAAVRTLLKE
jgi:hypothetical protein